MHEISYLHEARVRLRALARQQSVMLDSDLIGMVKLSNRRTA
jgi:hypothetical protein